MKRGVAIKKEALEKKLRGVFEFNFDIRLIEIYSIKIMKHAETVDQTLGSSGNTRDQDQ